MPETHVIAIADLHGVLPAIEPCDLLVIAGDICPHEHSEQQRAWLDSTFRPWLEQQPAAAIAGIAGNCDLAAWDNRALMYDLPWQYLENEAAEINGTLVYGSPLSLVHGAWPYMAPEQQLTRVWRQIPDETELLVVHGPPYGLGDRALDGRHTGSRTLRQRLRELHRLQAVVFGHIHEAAGSGDSDGIHWVNAAQADSFGEHGPASFSLA